MDRTEVLTIVLVIAASSCIASQAAPDVMRDHGAAPGELPQDYGPLDRMSRGSRARDGRGKGAGSGLGNGPRGGGGAWPASPGAWPLSVEMRPGPGGASRPLVYNHIAKTGGSFVKNVLLGLFPNEVNIVEEWQGLKMFPATAHHSKKRPFVIGGMRAPCDYYLSLWAMSSRGVVDRVVGTDPSLQAHLGKDASSGFNTAEDRIRFRRWVRGQASEHIGLLTARFWFSYFKDINPCRPARGDICIGQNSVFEGMKFEIDQDLQNTSMTKGLADCWLRTESLDADLENCLQQYESSSGASLDWTRFRELMASKPKNRSERQGECASFYDNRTERVVLEKDSHVVRIWGYPKCCASSGEATMGASPRHTEL